MTPEQEAILLRLAEASERTADTLEGLLACHLLLVEVMSKDSFKSRAELLATTRVLKERYLPE